jgi:hypothetical protein
VQSREEKSSAGRLFVPSLAVAFFSTLIIESLTSVFLVDVATERMKIITFQVGL